MSEEQTDRLEGGTPFEIRVLRELANINQRLNGLEAEVGSVKNRLTNLEEKVDARLYDTRPIWESVLSSLESINARLDRMDEKLGVLSGGWLDLRADVNMLKRRLPST